MKKLFAIGILSTVVISILIFSSACNRVEDSYTVSFDMDGGDVCYSIIVDGTCIITLPEVSARDGFIFAGWYDDESLSIDHDLGLIPQNDTTIYAKWTLIDYEITYNSNGGILDDSNPITYNIETADILLVAPIKTNYTFVSWSIDTTLADSETAEILESSTILIGTYGDLDLYANWMPTEYSINYYLNGGINNASNPASYTFLSDEFTISEPSREGYTFAGWFADSEYQILILDRTIEVGSTGNLEFYAIWSPNYSELEIIVNDITYGEQLNITVETNTSGGNILYEYKLRDANDNTYTQAIPKDVGAYTVRATSAPCANFLSAEVTEDFHITVLEITISIDDLSKTYGEADSMYTYTSSPQIIEGDIPNGAFSRAQGEAVGTYTIVIGTFELSNNYAVVVFGAELTINHKVITVSANPHIKEEGEQDVTLDYNYSPELLGTDVFTGTLVRESGDASGVYEIELGTLSLPQNYAIIYVPAYYSITEI